MIEWVISEPRLRLGIGDSVDYVPHDDISLVFSHLYGPLAPDLVGLPALVNVYGNKKAAAEKWCGAELHEVSKWHGGTNTIYAANMPYKIEVDLTDLWADEFAPARGWFPEELCRRLLNRVFFPPEYGYVFDGFMGRGTVGKVALASGLAFIGIDRDPARVAMAREYLGC